MYFIVLWISYVFLCFCDLCITLFFSFELFEYLNINNHIAVILTHNECKYCILELKMEFWHKKPFSICFVHKSRKFSNFEPTLDYIMLRNFRTVRLIFPKIAPKVAQNFERNVVMKARGAQKKFCEIIARNVEGGADSAPPRPF